MIETPCRECSRRRPRRSQEAGVESRFPAGIHDGQRIRLPARAMPARTEGRAGDAYVEVHVRPDKRLVRDGNDIVTTVDLTIVEAARGAKITGADARRRPRARARAGDAAGRGRRPARQGHAVAAAPGRGDQRVLVNVLVPRRLTDEQRALLARFQQLSGEDTYRPDEGFFEKLRSALR